LLLLLDKRTLLQTNKKRLKSDGNEQKEVEYKCPDCEYFTLRLGNMKRHRVGHERQEEFKCDRCSFSARLKGHLSFHSSRFHGYPPPPAAGESECSDCEYTTLRWDRMKRHRVGHEREEEFKCDRFCFSARLKCHVSVHSSRFHLNS